MTAFANHSILGVAPFFINSSNLTTLFPEGDSFLYMWVSVSCAPKMYRMHPFWLHNFRDAVTFLILSKSGKAHFFSGSQSQVMSLGSWAYFLPIFSFSAAWDSFSPQVSSLFRTLFPFWCSPCLINAPISSSFLWWMPVFSTVLRFCGRFSKYASYSHTSWILLPKGEGPSKGMPVWCLSYVYCLIFLLPANRNSSFLAYPWAFFWFLTPLGHCSAYWWL